VRCGRRPVNTVFQSYALFGHMSVARNVGYALEVKGTPRAQREAEVEQALERVGLSDRAKHKPTQLSGGQRQRVAIARALVNDPQLIIADEPTGNLDSSRGADVISELERLNREGITLIIITHDPNVANRAKRVLDIKDGKISERAGAR